MYILRLIQIKIYTFLDHEKIVWPQVRVRCYFPMKFGSSTQADLTPLDFKQT